MGARAAAIRACGLLEVLERGDVLVHHVSGKKTPSLRPSSNSFSTLLRSHVQPMSTALRHPDPVALDAVRRRIGRLSHDVEITIMLLASDWTGLDELGSFSSFSTPASALADPPFQLGLRLVDVRGVDLQPLKNPTLKTRPPGCISEENRW